MRFSFPSSSGALTVLAVAFWVMALMGPPLAVSAADTPATMSAQDFLKIVRRPPRRKTWAILSGVVANRKSGGGVSKAKLRLAIRFTSEMILARVALGDDEVYFVGQTYGAVGKTASVFKEGKGDRLGAVFGVSPEDLTMSFLFWKLEKELQPDSIKTMACRVFLLASPDGGRKVRVYIATKYFFPLKVEWLKETEKGKWEATRTLEARSFKKKNGLYLVDSLSFSGPGWLTRVDFPDCRAGLVADGVPKDLFAPRRLDVGKKKQGAGQ